MTNRAKQKGTAWESACAEAARPWWPWIERRALQGIADKGDLTHPTIVFQCKANPREHTSPAEMLAEVDKQMANAGVDVGFVWRKTIGKTSALDGLVIMRPAVLFDLLKKAGY